MRLLPAITSGMPLLDVVHHMDLLTLCVALPDASVDMVLADLPYGTTACAWDEVVPIEPMWAAFRRIIKPTGAIVLTACQPFTSRLVMSNLRMFRYEWIWEKTMAGGFPNAPLQPLRAHECILVFSPANAYSGNIPNPMRYYPQMEVGKPYIKKGRSGVTVLHGKASLSNDLIRGSNGKRYPRSVIRIANSNHGSVHPTQKPVALFEYLIRTYTQPGDLVVDPVVGSGTTAIAARNAERHFICGDKNGEYVTIARRRLADTDPFQARMLAPEMVQPSLFGQGRG